MAINLDVRRLAKGQDGLVTRQQALRAGLSDAAILHAVGSGRWQRVARGVYATFTGPLQARHHIRAALLCGGPGAVVSGAPACRAYGLRYVPADAETVVLVPRSARRYAALDAPSTPLPVLPSVRTRRVAAPPDARTVGGIPTAAPERAVLDVCVGRTSLQDVRALLCEAVQRGLTTPGRLRTALGEARWKGPGLVRRVCDDLVAGCRSAPECELRDLIRRSRVLDEPLWNHALPEEVPPLQPDACWPDARVVVEIDSAEWHRFGEQVEQTERRRARYAALGWTVVPVSPRRLREEPRAVLREIEAAVAERHGWVGPSRAS